MRPLQAGLLVELPQRRDFGMLAEVDAAARERPPAGRFGDVGEPAEQQARRSSTQTLYGRDPLHPRRASLGRRSARRASRGTRPCPRRGRATRSRATGSALRARASRRGRSRSVALSSRFESPSERVGPAASRAASASASGSERVGVVDAAVREPEVDGLGARARPRRASPSPWRAAGRRGGGAGTRRRRRRRGPTSRTTR